MSGSIDAQHAVEIGRSKHRDAPVGHGPLSWDSSPHRDVARSVRPFARGFARVATSIILSTVADPRLGPCLSGDALQSTSP